MEIKSYKYSLIVPPATSSVVARILVRGEDAIPIRRKDMKELVFQSVLNNELFIVCDKDNGIKQVFAMTDSDVDILKTKLEKEIEDEQKKTE